MKNIIVILLILLVSFSGCKKTDEKIEEKIVGHWKAETSNFNAFFLSISTSDFISTSFECTSEGKYIDYTNTSDFKMPCDALKTIPYESVSYGERPCSTAYQINDSHIEILVQVDSNTFEYKGIEIVKITNRKMILIDKKDDNKEFTYIKQD